MPTLRGIGSAWSQIEHVGVGCLWACPSRSQLSHSPEDRLQVLAPGRATLLDLPPHLRQGCLLLLFPSPAYTHTDLRCRRELNFTRGSSPGKFCEVGSLVSWFVRGKR